MISQKQRSILGQICRLRTASKYQTMMKLISKKNISLALALLMAGAIISSAKANTRKPEVRKASFVYSAELVAYVDDYFEELELIAFEEESTIKLFNEQDELVFAGLEIDMDHKTAQLYHKAKFLSQMAGADYYKILQ